MADQNTGIDIIQLISAAGVGGVIGGVVTTFFQAWLASKQYISNRNFQEKKEAYIGFLEAGHRSEIEKSDTSSIYFAHWQNRCELVASKKVIEAMNEIKRTNPISNTEYHPERPAAMQRLKDEMRKDLKVEL